MNEILPHRRRVLYYETDKMGIVHHSNYIRYMEEGRLSTCARPGWSIRTWRAGAF